MLLALAQGNAHTEIQRLLGASQPTIYQGIDKALAAGVRTGLYDRFHRPHAPQIGDEASAWVVALACRKPKDPGLPAVLWTLLALASSMAVRVAAAGFAQLSQAGTAAIWRTLDA